MHERGQRHAYRSCWTPRSSPSNLVQIHFGAALPISLVAVLKAKASSSTTLRKIVLEGHRFTPKEALSLGLVDGIVDGNTEAILTAAQALAEKVGPIAKTGAWGVNKVCVSAGA